MAAAGAEEPPLQLLFDKQQKDASEAAGPLSEKPLLKAAALPVLAAGAVGADGASDSVEAGASLPSASTWPPAARKMAPPAVHVPWSQKPLLNPLGSSELPHDPLRSPRKLPDDSTGSGAFGSFAGGSSGAFGSCASASSSVSGGPAPLPPSLFAPGSHKPSPLGSGGSSLPTSGGGYSLPSSLGSGGSAASGPPAPSASSAAAVRQQSDLSFAAPVLEANYRWVCDGGGVHVGLGVQWDSDGWQRAAAILAAPGHLLYASWAALWPARFSYHQHATALSSPRPRPALPRRRWVAPYLQRSDAYLGTIHVAVLCCAAAEAGLLLYAANSWLVLAGGLPALLWRAGQRLPGLHLRAIDHVLPDQGLG